MAHWPQIVRDHPFKSLLALAVTSTVALLVVALWGPIVWVSTAVLALSGAGLYAWYRRGAQAARARAAADTFSFADVVLRMRAKDAAQVLVATQRRQELLGAR
jgi:Flp pilus assembly protein TadB